MKNVLFVALLILLLTPFSAAHAQEDAETAAYMAALTPGAEHEWMAKMVGDFSFVQKVWMDPGQPPVEATGTSKNEMIMGGRYLSEHSHGEMWGMPFEGRNTLAYDNVSGKYAMSWIDNMGTGLMNGEGSRNGNKLSITCTSMDPVTKKAVQYLCETELISEKQHKFSMYALGKKGAKSLTMEIVYTLQ